MLDAQNNRPSQVHKEAVHSPSKLYFITLFRWLVLPLRLEILSEEQEHRPAPLNPQTCPQQSGFCSYKNCSILMSRCPSQLLFCCIADDNADVCLHEVHLLETSDQFTIAHATLTYEALSLQRASGFLRSIWLNFSVLYYLQGW